MTASSPILVIVDDETAYSDVLSQSLPDWLDVPILTFSRPQAALDALPHVDVGMIVSDYFMPQMDGLEFLRRARELKPNLRCLMVTGHGAVLGGPEEADLPELKEILAKPLPARVLAAAIKRHWPNIPLVAAAG